MADFFGAIAAGEIGSKRLPLIFPEPTPKNGVQFPLNEAIGQAPLAVYKKPSSRTELDAQIEALREYYTPFMQKLAPKPKSTRTTFLLKDFHSHSRFLYHIFYQEKISGINMKTTLLRGFSEIKNLDIMMDTHIQKSFCLFALNLNFNNTI